MDGKLCALWNQRVSQWSTSAFNGKVRFHLLHYSTNIELNCTFMDSTLSGVNIRRWLRSAHKWTFILHQCVYMCLFCSGCSWFLVFTANLTNDMQTNDKNVRQCKHIETKSVSQTRTEEKVLHRCHSDLTSKKGFSFLFIKHVVG